MEQVNRIFRDKKNYVPNKRESDKKFVFRNQTVKKGEQFIKPNTFKYEKFINKNGNYVMNEILFDKEIDRITINYQDFLSLNILGQISMGNLNHMKYIPRRREYEGFAIQAIKTIFLENFKQYETFTMKDTYLLKKFKDYANFDLEIFIPEEYSELTEFLRDCYYKNFKIVESNITFLEECTNPIMLPKFKDKTRYNTCPLEKIDLHSANLTTAISANSIKSTNYKDFDSSKCYSDSNNYRNIMDLSEIKLNITQSHIPMISLIEDEANIDDMDDLIIDYGEDDDNKVFFDESME